MTTSADIADAVVTTINSATLSLPVTAKRVYLPILDLQQASDLTVRVIPAAMTVGAGTRSHRERSYKIEIGIQMKLTSDDPSEIDPLVALAEEIEGLFTATAIPTLPLAHWKETTHDPLVAPEHLHEMRQFTSLITLTYSLWSPV